MNIYDSDAMILSARAGDLEAQSALLAKFRDYLGLLARLHVKPILQAKFDESDIVQETCLQASQSLAQFRGTSERQFAAWLRQILANKAAMLARQYTSTAQRDVQIEQRLQGDLDRSSLNMAKIISTDGSSPSQHAIRREESVILANALARIVGDQREVLIMHGLEGMPVADIAKRMGRTKQSTWKLWARGLQAIRKEAREVE